MRSISDSVSQLSTRLAVLVLLNQSETIRQMPLAGLIDNWSSLHLNHSHAEQAPS